MSVPTLAVKNETLLVWRVHLLRRDPGRLPLLLAALLLAAVWVGLLFGTLLPVVAALLLLLGATGEYLFPITYRLTREGVYADSLTGRLALTWKDARRCFADRHGLIVTPLPVASRLDAFRGILLRFAPEGEPGDRASVLEAVARCAPELYPQMTQMTAEAKKGTELTE